MLLVDPLHLDAVLQILLFTVSLSIILKLFQIGRACQYGKSAKHENRNTVSDE